ncbi:ankyrin repeat-containing protein BDA1-like isoform X2 [Herrania umbratica]|uniref:Ankyrin repeat-containing protein BDA1-like isoform X2 n=1 Tax=Herrania umbratica TaxID=108875 RepID=A0A6J1ANF7_9ROSI|nr:ankyrin repeat-containing protein BDA1-like isoform X2 [Herrania umbratica]
MEDALIQASQVGDIDALYKLIWEDDDILRRIDEKMFIDTPLHLAACSGQTHFAAEMINLMPSFTRKLNKSGFSPMHLALINGHFKLVSLFVHADPGLVRVKGRWGLTPLHYAIKHENIYPMVNFLVACPESIGDVTVRDALDWVAFIPNWKDEQGNTALDIAVSNMQIQAIQLLAEINAKNSKGEDASQILQRQTQLDRRAVLKMLRRHTPVVTASSLESIEWLTAFLRSKTLFPERLAVCIKRQRMSISGDVLNALLVVAGLIIAGTCQTMYNPPGSFREDNNLSTNLTNSGIHGGPSRNVAAATAYGSTLEVSVNSSILYFASTIVNLLLPDTVAREIVAALLFGLSGCYSMFLLIMCPYPAGTVLLFALFSIYVSFHCIIMFGDRQIQRLTRFCNANM